MYKFMSLAKDDHDIIYILLPVHNRRQTTQQFIACLKAQTFQNYHLILIDDGSTDGTEEIVRHQIQSLTVLKGCGDWWWSGSLQQGLNWLKTKLEVRKSDLILIINDDTEFNNDFLAIGMQLMSISSQTFIQAQAYSKQTKQLIDVGISIDWSKMSFSSVIDSNKLDCLSTRGIFLRVQDLETVGGFYPALLPHYGSDYEFTIRAQRQGIKLSSDAALYLWLDETTTGYHEVNEESLKIFWNQSFSKKSSHNPIMWTVFVGLACPWRWKLLNWFRIWKRFLWKLTQISVRLSLKSIG
jgi:GT2 family glycosyltransferase